MKVPVDERVIGIDSKRLGVDRGQITLEASFVDDLGASSTDIVDMFLTFEEVFEIYIDDYKADQILTVGGAIDYIQGKLAASA